MTVARAQDLDLPRLQSLLAHARAQHASDVHLRCGQPPWLRVQGVLVRCEAVHGANALTSHDMEALLAPLLSDAAQARLRAGHELDFAFEWPALGRFRANVLVDRLGLGAVLRCLGQAVPALASLHLPPAVATLLHGHGLVLVTGPTGSGKSTTLAALVQHLNRHTRQHILTLEDPIEYVHASDQCLVTQRGIGEHSPDFASALRAALREDPDVLLIGELRDLETIRLALTAAETGHLVLASLHTRHAAATVERIVDVFDAAEKSLVRAQLADVLRAVLSQTLCVRADGVGLTAVHELLVGTPAVRHLIREGKTSQLASVMQTGAAHGMVTMAQALHTATAQGRIAAGHGVDLVTASAAAPPL